MSPHMTPCPRRHLPARAAHTPTPRAALALLAAAAALAAVPPSTMAQAVVPSGNQIFKTVADVTAFGLRRPGTPASLGVSQYVHDRFKALGLERVAFEEADTRVWTASQWALSIDGRAQPISPMQHSGHSGVPGPIGTPAAGVSGEVVYVGKGSAFDYWLRDVRGKIVVADVNFGKRPLWLFKPFLLGVQDSASTFGGDYTLVDPYAGGDFPDSYYRAMDKGALGFVGVLKDYFDSHQYRNEAYASYDPGKAMRIPGAWMSPVAGGQLTRQLDASWLKARKPQGNLTMRGELGMARGRAVVGYLPGQTDEIILIQSHHDSATPGATEDASGTASVLALAEYFAQIPKAQRQRTLMFATMDTHFTDYAVHKAFARRHLKADNPLGEKVVAVVTLEHIAREVVPDAVTRQPVLTGQLAPRALMVSTEIPEFKDIALKAMRDHGLERTAAVATSLVQLVEGTPEIPADSSNFLGVGVPVIAFVGAPLYLYDEIDTLDKVPADELGRVARAFADVVHQLDRLPSDRFKRLPDKSDF